MRIRDRVLNITEEIVLKELSSIAANNSLRVFPKLRVSDAIEKDTYLDREHFSYYTRSHFDFLVTTPEAKPFMAIEYDGPFHSKPEQIANDEKKHFICKEAELPILRIGGGYVLQKYRGMTLLRWIIEVINLQEAFYKAQEEGQIPFDEVFDACAIVASEGNSRKFPYWLSAVALRQIHEFLDKNRPKKMGSFQLLGKEVNHRLHALE